MKPSRRQRKEARQRARNWTANRYHTLRARFCRACQVNGDSDGTAATLDPLIERYGKAIALYMLVHRLGSAVVM